MPDNETHVALTPSVITISVRNLVELVMRSGDLRYDFFGSTKAIEGIRAHQFIQRSRPESYLAEVPVSHTVDTGEIEIRVTGRLDGLDQSGAIPIIEEIKSTRKSLHDVAANPSALHWAQAKAYAHIWVCANALEQVVAHLTYVHLDTRDARTIAQTLHRDELAAFFDDLIQQFGLWAVQQTRWTVLRNRSIDLLGFPFHEYRSGQRDMAIAVYRTIQGEGHLLVQAATGIGKTMAALFPAIKTLAEDEERKIVFLTARTTGRLAAEAALGQLREHGLKLKSVALTAKDTICFHPDAACTPDECACAKGYFDRLNDALNDALAYDEWSRERIEDIARNHCVCPFEFSLELVNWADCIICDYNYAFAPGVILQRLFAEQVGRHVLLIDEAHNMVDRARDMFSAHLDKRPILALRRLVKEPLPKLYRALGRVNAWMAKRRRACSEIGGQHVESEGPYALLDRLQIVLRQAEAWLSLNHPSPFREALLSLYFDVLRFVRVADRYDASYTTIYRTDQDNLRVTLFCIDPALQLGERWNHCRSAILFSATLTPAGYFQSVLGCPAETRQLSLPSPFPRANFALFVVDGVSTYFKDRQASADAVCTLIGDLAEPRSGNYMAYFPSYAYLELIHQKLCDAGVEFEIQVQTSEMAESRRDAFLARFREDSPHTVTGFAVMGGVFGEGIDLKGEQLCGALIAGVGLPGICLERDLIRQYYDRMTGDGYAFAYQYPGINRVLQAAGRVIRSETDRGVVVLVDRRYGQSRYRALFPAHWDPVFIGKAHSLKQRLRQFWGLGEP